MMHRFATLGLALAVLFCGNAPRAAEPEAKPAAGTPSFSRQPNGDLLLGNVTLHRERGELSFPATVNQLVGPVEVLIATQQGRLHESLLRTDIEPLHLQTMLLLLNCSNGARLPGGETPQGDLLDIDLQWQSPDGTTKRERVENWLVDNRTGTTYKPTGWVFVGSRVVDGAFMATTEGNVATVYIAGETVLETADPDAVSDTIFNGNSAKEEPGLNMAVRVIVRPRGKTP